MLITIKATRWHAEPKKLNFLGIKLGWFYTLCCTKSGGHVYSRVMMRLHSGSVAKQYRGQQVQLTLAPTGTWFTLIQSVRVYSHANVATTQFTIQFNMLACY